MLEYAQMYSQALDTADASFTGFNRFAHDRNLARPGYAPFKTPNADTLYSNAWLDLSHGPVVLSVPDAGTTYFTVNFLDIYGNSSNISARTRGFGPGKYAIVPLGWEGSLPDGVEKFTVTTPYCWILMRVLAKDLSNPARARQVQNGFTLQPLSQPDGQQESFPAPAGSSAEQYLRVLDWIVRNAGYPVTETALVHRYRAIGVGLGPEAIDKAFADPDLVAGIKAGHAAALEALDNSSRLSGYPAATWKMPADTGAYGYNYFYRAAINTLGTGANVSIENYPFNTFADGDGDPLDGGKHDYRLTFAPPPPARFFWSLTLYDAKTRELSANPIARYIINDRTPGLVRTGSGAIPIAIQHERPKGKSLNWLPAPDGPFYLVIRAQGPEPALIEGKWLPPAVQKVKP
ncbi:DUF1254 domain-containing protein [Novosphingobium album (ex Hu et al. 2023)]|uniref:DUF1254 domain-containing protein n=1 Tax=Novosphingobium album (ex Hu et al. 2023) TaxID=2930093 RepID=A0ABT0B3B1_9SPHN|nr:DUF1254 domain-containing protein [Novosphingobium album (ex Hu et al. 2023)]MCJ2179400.1 DUF1254 domain-containing protein [Novosphingobium album (ex Hu et al. 2023)]